MKPMTKEELAAQTDLHPQFVACIENAIWETTVDGDDLLWADYFRAHAVEVERDCEPKSEYSRDEWDTEACYFHCGWVERQTLGPAQLTLVT